MDPSHVRLTAGVLGLECGRKTLAAIGLGIFGGAGGARLTAAGGLSMPHLPRVLGTAAVWWRRDACAQRPLSGVSTQAERRAKFMGASAECDPFLTKLAVGLAFILGKPDAGLHSSQKL